MQLTVIIVNYNVKYFAEQCLYTVISASKNLKVEIIVIDNNSTDGSRDFFSNKFASVQFIWNEKNMGFSKANNIALQKAKGKYILFLNPDTLVAEDCFEKCLAFFEFATNIGALGIRMIDGNGAYLKESKRGFPTLITSFFKLNGFAVLFPYSKFFASYYAGHLSENKNQVVDVLAGAFMLVDKKVLDEIGSFDEDFFMYGEDIDLSYRIQKAGYKNYYFSESTIIHFKGESTNKNNLQHVKVFYGAMNLFVRKHYSSTTAALYSTFIQMALWLKIFFAFWKRSESDLKKYKKATSDTSTEILIVATEKEYSSVVGLLKEAGLNWTIIDRVKPQNLDNSSAVGSLKDLPKLIDKFAVKKIIFCIGGELQMKEIIDKIQCVQLQVSYFFHQVDSTSVVGSNNKNTTGDYIAVNPG